MLDRLSFRKTFLALENAIGLAHQRHTLIASNVSKLDAPNYKAKEIDFKTALSQVLESDHEIELLKTNPRHIGLRINSAHKVNLLRKMANGMVITG